MHKQQQKRKYRVAKVFDVAPEQKFGSYQNPKYFLTQSFEVDQLQAYYGVMVRACVRVCVQHRLVYYFKTLISIIPYAYLKQPPVALVNIIYMYIIYLQESGIKMFRFEAKAFHTIRALLDYHAENGMAVTRASEAIIQRPVPKHDKWSISHANIKIGNKIGKGAFGDVFMASFLGDKVAVKSCRSSDVADMDKFMMEADILKQYDHPNIVR